jgi:methylated-DNA-[protein]-cysteine S-methyltransferase
MNYQHLDTPIGTLRLVSNGAHILKIAFEGQYNTHVVDNPDNILVNCADQLNAYFAGKRKCFDLPLGANGTPFQQRVWSALAGIPYGELRSYKDIACIIGHPAAVRAVGAANGHNPLPIVVPCHRVIGSNGRLTGFAGGLEAKSYLLQLEARLLHQATAKDSSASA